MPYAEYQHNSAVPLTLCLCYSTIPVPIQAYVIDFVIVKR